MAVCQHTLPLLLLLLAAAFFACASAGVSPIGNTMARSRRSRPDFEQLSCSNAECVAFEKRRKANSASLTKRYASARKAAEEAELQAALSRARKAKAAKLSFSVAGRHPDEGQNFKYI